MNTGRGKYQKAEGICAVRDFIDVFLAKYYQDSQIKTDEMVRLCEAYGDDYKSIEVFLWEDLN